MNKEEKLGIIFDELANELNITTTMLERAETAYTALGDYIKQTNQDWDVSVYPQGSFELGTVVKPLNEDEQYDVDLVVLVKKPFLDAQNLRLSIRDLLQQHGRYVGKIEDKKPCIRIQYADSAQFHMDIACAKESPMLDTNIDISRFDESNNYYYDISNPKGYVKWFKTVMNYEEVRKGYFEAQQRAETEVEDLKLTRVRTPLQKAIQILKRHRDIYFSGQNNIDEKPSSIIITTLCALTYDYVLSNINAKGNVYKTILNMIDRFPAFINRNENGDFQLMNPSRLEENFLKKWNEHYEHKQMFDNWIMQAKLDIVTNPEAFIDASPEKFKETIERSFGGQTSRIALGKYGERISHMADSGVLKFSRANGNITTSESDESYRKHVYFGGECDK